MIHVPRPRGSMAIDDPGGLVSANALAPKTKTSTKVVIVRCCTQRRMTGRQLGPLACFFHSVHFSPCVTRRRRAILGLTTIMNPDPRIENCLVCVDVDYRDDVAQAAL